MLDFGRVPAIPVSQSQVVNLGLNVVGFGGMDRLLELQDQKLQELGAGSLQGFPEAFRRHFRLDLIGEKQGQIVDRGVGVVESQVQDSGVAVLRGIDLEVFERA